MADDLGVSVLRLTTDSTGLNKGIDDARGKSEGLGLVFGSTVTAINQGLELVQKGFEAVNKIFDVTVRKAADYADGIRDMSKQTGIATTTLSGLDLQAKLNGTSLENMSVGFRTLAGNFQSAVNGSSEARDKFAALGLTSKDLIGTNGDLEAIYRLVLSRFGEMPESALKSALAVDFFGRSGERLKETLGEGVAGLDRAIDKTKEYGTNVSTEAGDAADHFNDQLTVMNERLSGTAMKIGVELMPTVLSLVTKIEEVTGAVVDFTEKHSFLTKTIAATVAIVTGVGGLIVGYTAIVTILGTIATAAANAGVAITAMSSAATVGVAAAAVALVEMVKLIYDIDQAERQRNATMAQTERNIENNIAQLHVWGVEYQRAGKDQQTVIRETMALTQEHFKKEIKARQDAYDATKKQTTGLVVWAKTADDAATQVIDSTGGVIAEVHAYGTTSDLVGQLVVENWMRVGQKLETTAVDVWEDIVATTEKAYAAMEDFSLKRQVANSELAETEVDENAKVLGVIVKAEEKSANQSAQAWKNAIEGLNTRLAESFADMIMNAKFNFKSLEDIVKTTMKNMLSAVISGFLSPVTNKLASLGGQLAGAIGLGGSGAGSGGGAGGAGGIGGLSGIATLGIGAAASAVALLVTHFVGKGRRTADEFVTQFQNPFNDILAGIVQTGTVSDLDQAWAAFNKTESDFASQGGTEEKVGNQALATLTPIVAGIRTDLVNQGRTGQTINVMTQPSQDPNQVALQLYNLLSSDAELNSRFQALWSPA